MSAVASFADSAVFTVVGIITTAIIGLAVAFLLIKYLYLITGYIYGAFRSRRYGCISRDLSWNSVFAVGWSRFRDHGDGINWWQETDSKRIPLFGFQRVKSI